jgi:hypothetical protein
MWLSVVYLYSGYKTLTTAYIPLAAITAMPKNATALG